MEAVPAEPGIRIWRRHIALPQQHGSWALWLCPYVVGLVVGGTFRPGLIWLSLASLGAFLALQPLTIAVKALAGRRPGEELRPASIWLAGYGALIGAGSLGLIVTGDGWVLALGLIAAPVLAWQMWLVSRREERGQMGVELVGSIVLALGALAGHAVSVGALTSDGLWLWILTGLQAAGAIIYVFRSLAYRRMSAAPAWPDRWRLAWRALLFNLFNLLFVGGLALAGAVPAGAALAFGLMLAEVIYGNLMRPPAGVRPVIIGLRQTAVTILFSLALILAYR